MGTAHHALSHTHAASLTSPSPSSQAGPDAATLLAQAAPHLLTFPPPLLNAGRFELTGWAGLAEGEAAHGAPAHGAPAAYGPGDPRFDPELDG